MVCKFIVFWIGGTKNFPDSISVLGSPSLIWYLATINDYMNHLQWWGFEGYKDYILPTGNFHDYTQRQGTLSEVIMIYPLENESEHIFVDLAPLRASRNAKNY